MSKIEVNEYVRTKDGEIGIFKGYNNNKKSQWSCKVKLPRMKFWKYYTEEYIVKYSKQLMELIENRDILKVKTIDKDIFFLGIDEETSDIAKYEEITQMIKNGEYELLGILTHEQFEANCFKVGGKDE